MGTHKIILGIAIAIGVILCALNFLLVVPLDWNDKWGRTASDLGVIGYAIRKVTLEKQMTPDDWERVIAAKEFADLLGSGFDDPQIVRVDSWGQPLVIEKQKANDQLRITIRSSYRLPRRLFWQKSKILGIEVTIFHDLEKPPHIKHLWNDD